MAVKRTGNQRKKSPGRAPSGKMPVSVILWVFFFIILIMLIFMLWPSVKRSWVDFSESRKPPVTAENPLPERPSVEPGAGQPPDGQPGQAAPETAPQQPSEEGPQAGIPPGTPQEIKPGETEPQVPVIETRDRTVYFMQLDRDGNILRPVKVTRKLRVSTSPLLDSLNALLAGATAEEKRTGLDSFIPQNSRILSVRIEGNTVFISFNDEFQYNPLGREGCEAQIQQIVWTATEFANVHNVQILINGRKVDFLSEGINVSYPIGRQ
jgi:hypothetical protein